MAEEAGEVAEAQAAIADMERKKRMKDDHKENLLVQIEETKLAIEKKRASRLALSLHICLLMKLTFFFLSFQVRAAERQALAIQQSKNAPELAFWEDHLGMRIEGAGIADHLKITYTHLVDADWSKEFWFVVSMMSRDYEGIYIYTRCWESLLHELTNWLPTSHQVPAQARSRGGCSSGGQVKRIERVLAVPEGHATALRSAETIQFELLCDLDGSRRRGGRVGGRGLWAAGEDEGKAKRRRDGRQGRAMGGWGKLVWWCGRGLLMRVAADSDGGERSRETGIGAGFRTSRKAVHRHGLEQQVR